MLENVSISPHIFRECKNRDIRNSMQMTADCVCDVFSIYFQFNFHSFRYSVTAHASYRIQAFSDCNGLYVIFVLCKYISCHGENCSAVGSHFHSDLVDMRVRIPKHTVSVWFCQRSQAMDVYQNSTARSHIYNVNTEHSHSQNHTYVFTFGLNAYILCMRRAAVPQIDFWEAPTPIPHAIEIALRWQTSIFSFPIRNDIRNQNSIEKIHDENWQINSKTF